PGHQIIFQSTRAGTKRQLYALDPSTATGAVRRIATDLDEDRFPAWAGDGTVLFSKATLPTCVLPNGAPGLCNYALWQMNADGTSQHQIDPALGEPASPQPLFGQAYPNSAPR
ncbi:MAG TPA: hypothetical protein VF942_13355, partial [Acidimicrobiales bacterium]